MSEPSGHKMALPGQYIVEIDGKGTFGPFATRRSAQMWAMEHLRDGAWNVAPLRSPDIDEVFSDV